MAKRYHNLYSLAKFLKEQLLPDVSVYVKRSKMPSDSWADCDGRNRREFRIRIDRKVSEKYAIFFLMHEFAHALSWDIQIKDHGIEWGKAMSKVYCAYLKWIDLCDKRDAEKKAACKKKGPALPVRGPWLLPIPPSRRHRTTA